MAREDGERVGVTDVSIQRRKGGKEEKEAEAKTVLFWLLPAHS